jgi:hypothetical protein
MTVVDDSTPRACYSFSVKHGKEDSEIMGIFLTKDLAIKYAQNYREQIENNGLTVPEDEEHIIDQHTCIGAWLGTLAKCKQRAINEGISEKQFLEIAREIEL